MTPSRSLAQVLVQIIAMDVTCGVRKSLILRKPCRQPQRGTGVYTWNGDGPSTLRGRGMARFDTLNPAWMVWDGPAPAPEEAVLEYTRELERFLAEVERRAFRIAQVSLRDPDDALDVVQDAMIKLTRSYASRPSAEWRPLFYRILENGIRDLQRRRTVRKRFMTWLPGPEKNPEHQTQHPLENVADAAPALPERLMPGQARQQ